MQVINSHGRVGALWKESTRRPSSSTSNCRQLTLLVRCDGVRPTDGKPSSSATTVHRLIAVKGALLIPGQQTVVSLPLKCGSCLTLTCHGYRYRYIPSVWLLLRPPLPLLSGCYDALSAKVMERAGHDTAFVSGCAVSTVFGMPPITTL